jgi:hypothetical protein
MNVFRKRRSFRSINPEFAVQPWLRLAYGGASYARTEFTMTMTSDIRDTLIRARQKNIDRHYVLLTTDLTSHEREYLHRRIAEEQDELERLLKSAADSPCLQLR